MNRAAAGIAILALAMIPTAMAQVHGHGDQGDEPIEKVTIMAKVPTDRIKAMATPAELERGVYVGDEYCISCHTWAGITRGVKHRQALRSPFGRNTLVDGRGVVADYDQNGVDDFMDGLDFNLISSVFDDYKPNAPILSYNKTNDTYWMTIGDLTTQVWITQGGTGDWKQRYLVRVPLANGGWAKDMYVSPLQYNEATDGWVAYHPEHWWNPDTKAPQLSGAPARTEVAAVGRSYSKRCIGCHTTGIRNLMQDTAGEYRYIPYPATLVHPDYSEQYPDYDQDGIPDIVNIGCEACHGPGSKHILGGGDPEQILAPSELDAAGQNEICQQCHIRAKSVPSGKFGWPRNEVVQQAFKSWIPGVTEEPLTDFYTPADGRWPDGIHAKQHHQQWQEYQESSKPTFPFHQVTCTECHSPHRGGEHMVRTRIEEDGITINTRNDDNTLCLACHATHGDFEDITVEQVANYDENLDEIATVVAAHTNHPYAPDRMMGLSRCSMCHMPAMAKSAVDYDVHSHTFEAVAPEKTLMYQAEGGMPNSCAVSCHSNKVIMFGVGYDENIGQWNEVTDVQLAEKLMWWYGPGGLWWDTDIEKSSSRRALRKALPPGSYDPPEPDTNDD